MDKKTTCARLRQRVPPTLPPADGARLIDVVETEVVSLHEGNITRFRLSPPEFGAWKKIWRQATAAEVWTVKNEIPGTLGTFKRRCAALAALFR